MNSRLMLYVLWQLDESVYHVLIYSLVARELGIISDTI